MKLVGLSRLPEQITRTIMSFCDITFVGMECTLNLYSAFKKTISYGRYLRTKFKEVPDDAVLFLNEGTLTQYNVDENNRLLFTEYLVSEPSGIHQMEFEIVSTSMHMTLGLCNPDSYSLRGCLGDGKHTYVISLQTLNSKGYIRKRWMRHWSSY